MNCDSDKYHLLIENLPDAFAYHQVVTAEDGTPVDYIFLEANAAFEEMTGLKREQIIGNKVTEVLPGIEKSEFDWIGTYGQVALSGETTCFESFSEPLGRWYEVGAYSEETGFFATVFRDISKQKQAEDDLRKTQFTVDKSPLSVFWISPEGKFIYVNETAAKKLGYLKDELLSMHVWDVDPHYPQEKRKEQWNLHQQEGERIIESEHRRRDGTTFPVRINSRHLAYAGREMEFAEVEDITEQKQVEKLLRDQSDLTQSYLDTTDTIMVSLDPAGNITMLNRYGLELLEYDQEQLIGKNWFEVVLPQPEGMEDVYPVFKQIMNGDLESVSYHENEVLTASGKQYTIAWRNNHLLDDNRKIISTLSSGIDITNRKEAEEAIYKLNEDLRLFNVGLEEKVKERTAQLEAANRELDAFTYSASHDLRGPLNRIDGFSRALLEDYTEKLDQQGQDYLRRISNSSRHMGELIADLLKLSRVSQMQTSREPVELSALVNINLKEHQAREPDRQLETVIKPGLIAEGDTALLRIALENLLDNAWKYTAGEDKALIEFGSMVQEGKETFYIKDNGTGFDMKHAEKLFTAFQRLHDAKTYPGTGIGLSIVYRIITRHGGEIWAEGEVGKGACFYFTLP